VILFETIGMEMKLKVVLCEKLCTQNTHVAIMENVTGVVSCKMC